MRDPALRKACGAKNKQLGELEEGHGTGSGRETGRRTLKRVMEERFRERTWMKCGGRTCRNIWDRTGTMKERRRYLDEDMQQT